LKKEHEAVRQETVRTILAEQKFNVDILSIKKETDELNNVSTVKPVKQGHPWDEPQVSLIERCPHFTGQLALRTAFWNQRGVLISQDVLISQGRYSQVSL
jgi:hypothetical protein